MEGRQPNRLGESLTSRQKRVLGVVSALLAVLFAGVGIWAAVTPGSYGRSGNGCVNVVVPSTTGGGILHRCGGSAQTLCRQALSGHDRFAQATRSACRQAGLMPAGGQSAP